MSMTSKLKNDWMRFWDNVNIPLLKRIQSIKRKKPTVWDLK
jgi:hypothetical protein